MWPRLWQNIRIVLVVAIALAAIRLAYILYERRTETVKQARAVPALNPDYYVIPKKLYPYDLKTAKQLTRQPVWVKVGYSITYYPYDESQRRSDFSHAAGLLLPIEKLNIKDVGTDSTPGAPGQRQVMAIFEDNGKSYGFPVGSLKDGNYTLYSDDMLFIQDPHELYRHWPGDVWQAVDRHEVKLGMSELQVGFALGLGIPQDRGAPGNRVLRYPDGGAPLLVTYVNGRVASVTAGR